MHIQNDTFSQVVQWILLSSASILEDMVAPAAPLQRVSRQAAYSLLHYGVNARLNYLGCNSRVDAIVEWTSRRTSPTAGAVTK